MNKKQKNFRLNHSFQWYWHSLLIGLFIVPIPYYIEGPGTTENLKEFVTVDGKKIRSQVLLFNNGGHSFGHYFSAIKANFSDFQEVMSKKN